MSDSPPTGNFDIQLFSGPDVVPLLQRVCMVPQGSVNSLQFRGDVVQGYNTGLLMLRPGVRIKPRALATALHSARILLMNPGSSY